jgi:hypothetical protein
MRDTVAEMALQPGAQCGIAGHVDEYGFRGRVERFDLVIAHDLIIAAKRPDEGRVRKRGQADHTQTITPRVQEMCESERGLAGRGGEDYAVSAKEADLGKVIVDQERQHEQRPQQGLIIALAPGESADRR